VRRSVMRVLLAVLVVSAGGVAWADLVSAAGKEINATADAAKCDKTWGPPCFTPSNGTVTQVTQGDTVTWRSLDGTHTVTPVDPSAFKESGDLTGPDGTFSVTFDKTGTFSFYCRHHGSVEDGGKTHHGMWGKIEVKAGAGTTTTTAPPAPPPDDQPPPSDPDPAPAPAPPPTRPPSPPPTSSPPPTHSNGSTGGEGGQGGGSQGSSGQSAAELGRPWVGPPPTQAAPPPTRTASAPPPTEPPSKPKDKEKERESSSDSTVPPDPALVPPDEAVLPPSPQFPTATTAPLAVSPGEVPHGDTIAVLKNEAGGRKRKLVLFGTIFGVGAFAAGVGGWKYMNRPSKYWPA
jgi:plastocyanin